MKTHGATCERVDQRVAEMITILSNRPMIHKCTLHKELTKRWECHWKTVDNIIARARKEMLDRIGRPKEVLRCESASVYEAIATDTKASPIAKIQARRAFDDLLGLNAPRQMRTEISGPDGGKIAIETKVKDDFDFAAYERVQRELLGLSASNGNGEPVLPQGAAPEASRVLGSNGH